MNVSQPRIAGRHPGLTLTALRRGWESVGAASDLQIGVHHPALESTPAQRLAKAPTTQQQEASMNTDLPAAVPYVYTGALYVDGHLEGIGGISLGVNVADSWVVTRSARTTHAQSATCSRGSLTMRVRGRGAGMSTDVRLDSAVTRPVRAADYTRAIAEAVTRMEDA